MATLIKTRIVKIGNSQGIRIPKLLLDQTNLREEVELEVQDNHIIIRDAHSPRAGWEDSFKQMAANNDDRLLDDSTRFTDWDEDEWEW